MASRFSLLARYLERRKQDTVRMSFEEIEKIVRGNLPRSAFDHRAWWANSVSHSHARHGWMKAGYETAEVDMEKQTLVLYKTPTQQPGIYSSTSVSRSRSRISGREGTARKPDEDALLEMVGGEDNAMRIFEAISEYINGEISELELGQYMRKYWPR